MTSLNIFLIMLAVFFAIFFSEIFRLKKEVRKLNNIVNHILKERKNKNP